MSASDEARAKAAPRAHDSRAWTGDEDEQALPYKNRSCSEQQQYNTQMAKAWLIALVVLFTLAGLARLFGAL